MSLFDPSAIGYPALFVGVLVGSSVMPLVPTGALVGAAAAIATTTGGMSLPLVIVLSTVAALLGDLLTFGAAKAGSRLALRWAATGRSRERLDAARARFADRGALLVVIGRLVPAGRIPVLLAAGTLDYPWRRLAPAALVACVVWALAYAALGAASGGITDDPLLAPLLAALLVLITALLTWMTSAWRRRRRPTPASRGVSARESGSTSRQEGGTPVLGGADDAATGVTHHPS